MRYQDALCHSLFYPTANGDLIARFHCHTVIKTIEQIKSRIKEIKEYEYSNSLAKIQVCAMFCAGDFEETFYSNL